MDIAIGGPITRAGIAGLRERTRAPLEGDDADLLVCALAGLVGPDAVTIEALARLQLTARRLLRLNQPVSYTSRCQPRRRGDSRG